MSTPIRRKTTLLDTALAIKARRKSALQPNDELIALAIAYFQSQISLTQAAAALRRTPPVTHSHLGYVLRNALHMDKLSIIPKR